MAKKHHHDEPAPNEAPTVPLDLDVSTAANAPDPNYVPPTTMATQLEGVVLAGASDPGREAPSIAANRPERKESNHASNES